MTSIYVPGKGLMDTTLLSIEKALTEYDERLYLKFNEERQQWCVWVKVPRPSEDIPVLGLDPNVRLHKDYVMEKIISMDTQRHANNMLDMIDKHNAKLKAEQNQKFLGEVEEHGNKITSAWLSNKINYKV